MCELREVNEAYQFFQKRQTDQFLMFLMQKNWIDVFNTWKYIAQKHLQILVLLPGSAKSGLAREK